MENSVGDSSPASVRVSSKFRRVAGSISTYWLARSATKVWICERDWVCVRPAYRSKAPAAAIPVGRSSTSKPAKDCMLKCANKYAWDCSASKCQGGIRVAGTWSVKSNSTSSAIMISAGSMRCNSESKASGAHSVILNAPFARFSQAKPTRGDFIPFLGRNTAATLRSALEGKSASSVSVPGVTMRIILRSTGPLLVAGSPICSQMATDTPCATSLARYCSAA